MPEKSPQLSDEEERQRRHLEARGNKRIHLKDLAKELPSESDASSYFRVVQGESDRGVVIMGSALLEHALTKALRRGAGNPADSS